MLKLLFCDILRTNCHADFKCGSINFLKHRKQPVKYHHLGTLCLSVHKMNFLRLRAIDQARLENDISKLEFFAVFFTEFFLYLQRT